MNATMIQFSHWYTPGDSFLWDHVAEQASYLADLGITAAWLPPASKAAGGGYSTGYDVYDLFDLGEFDQKGSVPTKYGSRDQLLNACKVLQENGVGVIVDVVLNHRGGGDELESFHVVKVDHGDRTNTVSEPYEIRSYTKFTFPGRGNKYSAFKWNFTCFTGVDYAEGEEGNGIYRIITDHGDDWDGMIDDEMGNYDFLMLCDVETRNEHVCGELNYWGKWFHEQVGFHGVRLDAVKHISPQFYKDWLHILRENTGENLFAVGAWFKPHAYALILLRAEGYPCVFYPDLYGANYTDKGSDGEDYEIELAKVPCLENLLRARRDHAYGEQNVYFDAPDCIGFTRLGDGEHPGCAVVMGNREAATKRMEMGRSYAGKTFRDALEHLPDEIVIGKDGWGEFPCPAGGVSVWGAG